MHDCSGEIFIKKPISCAVN